MKNPLRNLIMHWRRLFGPKRVVIDGVKIDTALIPSRHIQNLLFKGLYEADERKLLSKLCQPNDRVLELGAGIGVIGLIAANRCPDGAVVSYGTSPIFRLETGGYRKVALTSHGSTAEIIYTGNMTCDGGHIGTCGSGGCLAHIIFDDMDYPIRGSEPFLLVPQGTEISSDDANEVTAVIAWDGWGGYCRTQEDPETEPLRDCLLTAYIDPVLGRLTFQHEYGEFPR